MTITKNKSGDVLHLTIEDELIIYTVAELNEELLDCLKDTDELEIDLSAVSEIDSAGLQVLLMLKHEAEQQGKQLRLINHSQSVFEVFELLNVATLFGDPMIIPAEWQQ